MNSITVEEVFKKFKELTELYYEVHQNEEKHQLFMKKCAEITP